MCSLPTLQVRQEATYIKRELQSDMWWKASEPEGLFSILDETSDAAGKSQTSTPDTPEMVPTHAPPPTPNHATARQAANLFAPHVGLPIASRQNCSPIALRLSIPLPIPLRCVRAFLSWNYSAQCRPICPRNSAFFCNRCPRTCRARSCCPTCRTS